ncbi:aspartate/glutamate racemase family protein [Robertkochia sediminum]|uniref:aspartate/glutamate racemase family protein n=1 Tax=Robertkochia sediminum TaxID=2785326 RepID=UPI0019320FDD|nr:amino acid racemase [Robertkochia sediminum]MBL7472951.1 amino acid racemase [Robertkochia sediminum]
MKTLGLIGGTSWYSTVEYYKLINEMVAAELGSQANPELIIYSINIEIMRSQDWDRINEKYLEVAKRLQAAGAEGILICANTPHKVFKYVQPRIDIPILHIASATGKEAAKHGLKTLGLLGNKPTMTLGYIPEVLEEEFGINTIIPEHGGSIAKSHYFISKELTRGEFTEKAKAFYLEQIRALKERGADGIILGCTELPILLEDVKADIPLLKTTDLHAQMAAEFILGE